MALPPHSARERQSVQSSDGDASSRSFHTSSLPSTISTGSKMTDAISQELRRQYAKLKETSMTAQSTINRLSVLLMSSYTEAGVFSLVCVDVVMVLCSVQLGSFERKRLWWTSVCHGLLLIIFSLEASARLFCQLLHRSMQHQTSYDQSFTSVLWDTCLVMSGVLGACVWGLQSLPTTVPSLLRISRVSRLTGAHSRFLTPFQMLLMTIGDSLNILFSSLCLLLLNTIFFSVLAMGILQPEFDEQVYDDAVIRFGSQAVENCLYVFSSLFTAASTMFALSIGGQWHDVALPAVLLRPWVSVVFVVHSFIASGVIIGLVFGVLYQSLQRSQSRHVHLDEITRLDARKAVLDDLEGIFQKVDLDGSGYLTWQEFHHNWRTNSDLYFIMEKLGLEDTEVQIMWDVMDTSRDGKVSKDEFIKFMWKVLFDGERWSRLKTMHCAAQAHYRSEEVNKDVKYLQEEILTNRILMEKVAEKLTVGLRETVFTAQESTSSGAEQIVCLQKELETPDVTVNDENEMLQATAVELMRCVDAELVSHYGTQDVVSFWAGGAFIDKFSDKEFNMSRPCRECDYFVSHCWNPPKQWHKYFQRNNRLETYEYLKAVELHNVLAGSKRIQAFSRGSISETTLWVDKCCIPQNDKEMKAACVALLEDFMHLSKGLIVILSWQYFTRLWCVYEWACYLRTGNAALVELGFDAFLKNNPLETLPLYIDSIEKLSVTSSQCFFVSDHAILEEKVFQYYNGKTPEDSFAAFERFAKCTAICLMAKQIVMWRARGSTDDETSWLDPFRELAQKLGYRRLGDVLRRAQPAMWFKRCKENQEAFDNVVKYWFDNDCMKYLNQERVRAVRKFPKRRRDSETCKSFIKSSASLTSSCASVREVLDGDEEDWIEQTDEEDLKHQSLANDGRSRQGASARSQSARPSKSPLSTPVGACTSFKAVFAAGLPTHPSKWGVQNRKPIVEFSIDRAAIARAPL